MALLSSLEISYIFILSAIFGMGIAYLIDYLFKISKRKKEYIASLEPKELKKYNNYFNKV